MTRDRDHPAAWDMGSRNPPPKRGDVQALVRAVEQWTDSWSPDVAYVEHVATQGLKRCPTCGRVHERRGKWCSKPCKWKGT